ncbi:unnamed protein product [Heligmosomoides polygyrus]|uniref:Reverse transcriptase domain-containing protein n=1 Tax=Heligmosomoides polygyrus TaxID=6339 RepID=A0A3P8HZN1_HELPZ|nr:unnamed protein product [Heligmosomoides polygyrus]
MESFGLKLNVKKTEYVTADEDESTSIKANGIELPRASVFKYLGSAITSYGGLLVEANSRLSAAWSKWRSLTGVLCDKKIPERLKSKIYRAVVGPVAFTERSAGSSLKKWKEEWLCPRCTAERGAGEEQEESRLRGVDTATNGRAPAAPVAYDPDKIIKQEMVSDDDA